MLRPSRQQIDEAIVDRAAALFAQHGFAHTSLQQIADAAGYSKAGLLHHFPSKEALHAATETSVEALAAELLTVVAPLPIGPDRDRRALEAVADWALASPGVVALGLSAVSALADGRPVGVAGGQHPSILGVFGVGDPGADPDRVVRVVTALAGLLVTTLAAQHVGETTSWRRSIIGAAYDALGHRAARATAPTPHPVEV